VEGELSQVLRERKMLKKISLLTGHYIVCGVGKTGSYIVSELLKTKRDFVVIDKNKDVLQKYENCLCIAGDANDEEILKNTAVRLKSVNKIGEAVAAQYS
jgi:voltage-gated potassium channel